MRRHLDTLDPVFLADPINRQHPLAQGLAAWWLTLPGLDGGAKWYDLCGLNHGTLTNMTTSASGWRGTTRPGGFGHLLFDGTDDYVSMGTQAALVPATNKATLTGWFNVTSVVGTMVLIGCYTSNRPYLLWVNAGALKLNCNGTAVISSGGTLSAGAWSHVAATMDCPAGASALYLNGKLVTTGNTAGASFAAADPVTIGQVAAGVNYLAGSADDVCIYSRALSASEVRDLYDNSRLGYPGLLRRAP